MQGYRILLQGGDATLAARLAELARSPGRGPCLVVPVPVSAPMATPSGPRLEVAVLVGSAQCSNIELTRQLDTLRRALPHHPVLVLLEEPTPQRVDAATTGGALHVLPLTDLTSGLLQLALDSACRLADEWARARHLEARLREQPQAGSRGEQISRLYQALAQLRRLEGALCSPQGTASIEAGPALVEDAQRKAAALRATLSEPLQGGASLEGCPTALGLHSLVEKLVHEAATSSETTLVQPGPLTPMLGRIDPHLAECIVLELLELARRHPHLRDGCTVSLSRHALPAKSAPGSAAAATPAAQPYACLQVLARCDTPSAAPTTSSAATAEEIWLNRLVRLAGGYTRVQETAGWVQAVRVFLPCLPELEEATPQRAVTDEPKSPPAAPQKAASATVLVAEDQKEIRKLVRMVLESQGYAVLEAADGARALQIIESHEGTIELVISDLVMPHLGGLELAEKLAIARPGTPFLLMSGYNSGGSGFEGMATINKPFRPDELTGKVRSLLHKGAPHR